MEYKNIREIEIFLMNEGYSYEVEQLALGYFITIKTKAISRKMMDSVIHLQNSGLNLLSIMCKDNFIHINLYFSKRKGEANG